MNKVISNCIRLVLLVLFQILVLNNIHLGAYVNPYIYILFIIMLPSNIANWLLLILSFSLGFTIDLFSGEIGFHTFVTTLAGFSRIFILHLTAPRTEIESGFTPSIKTMGLKGFLVYSSLIVFVHHFFYFFLEIFKWSEFGQIFLRTLCSSLCTIFLIAAFQFLFIPKEK